MNKHRSLHWCNFGNKTVESTCLEERKDIAITFTIPHKRNREGLYTLCIKVFKNKNTVSAYQIPSLTFLQAKAYPELHMEEIMSSARDAVGPLIVRSQ